MLRREDRRLLTGQGQFIADLVLPRMLRPPRRLIALIDEAKKLWPHSSSVIAFTLRVETPCTLHLRQRRHERPLRTLIALEQLSRKAARAILRHPQHLYRFPATSWWLRLAQLSRSQRGDARGER